MASEATIAKEVDGILLAWRVRATRVVMMIASVIMLVPLLAILAGRVLELPWSIRAFCLFLYLPLLGATFLPCCRQACRVGVLCSALSAVGALQLAVGQLIGNGRIFLLLLPLFMLVLAGARAGWGAAALSTVLFTVVPLLTRTAFASDWPHVEGSGAPLLYWFFQEVFWLGALVPLMTLFTLFLTLQRRTMIAERLALRHLEQETADRRRLEAEVVRIGEMERQRFGAELHDGLCQYVAAALLNSTALKLRLDDAGSAEAAAAGKIQRVLEEAMEMARDLACGLNPVGVTREDLSPALERMCREVQTRQGIDCRFSGPSDLTLRDPEAILHLYRIASEAVTNAVKHTACRSIKVTLTYEADELILRVRDDGGTDQGEKAPGTGLGLRIMSYRASLIGGTFMTSELPDGWEVVCRVPNPKEPV